GGAGLGRREQAPVVDPRDQQHDPPDAPAAQDPHRPDHLGVEVVAYDQGHDVVREVALGHDMEALRLAQLARDAGPGQGVRRRHIDGDARLERNRLGNHRIPSPRAEPGPDGMHDARPGNASDGTYTPDLNGQSTCTYSPAALPLPAAAGRLSGPSGQAHWPRNGTLTATPAGRYTSAR